MLPGGPDNADKVFVSLALFTLLLAGVAGRRRQTHSLRKRGREHGVKRCSAVPRIGKC